jgi:parallel beta-helix repeat protein
MNKNRLKKGLAIGIIFIFIETCFIPGINADFERKSNISSIMENDLMAWWNFNEGNGSNAYDYSGNDNNGIINGASWTTGISGNALDFDGIDDYVNCGNTQTLNINNSITICAWIKYHTMNYWSQVIVGKWASITSSSYVLYLYNLTGGIIGKPGFSVCYNNDLHSDISLQADTWYFIAGTFNQQTDEYKLYLNGVVIYSSTFTGGISQSNEPVFIGDCTDSEPHYYDGIIDEVRIYNRSLTEAEIQELFIPPTTVYIDDDFNSSTSGWGYDHFSSIQTGIDAVEEGGTVFVYNGTYYENVMINKALKVIGENKNNTCINGTGTGDVVHISADNVYLSGFKILNSGTELYPAYDACINVRSKYNTIDNNWIVSNNYGIFLYYSSENKIVNNKIVGFNPCNGQPCGMMLSYSSFNLIDGNNIQSNFCGFVCEVSCDNNIVINNSIFDNYIGINGYSSTHNNISFNNISFNRYYGIYEGVFSKNKISNNTICSNGQFGIYFTGNCNSNILSDNNISSNGFNGIEIYSSSNNNSIFNNNINLNQDYGIKIWQYCYVNKIYHNNLMNNNVSAYDECSNIWDNGYPSGGNYWSDYNGTDADGDGIGDSPYNLSGGNNQDLYPIIKAYGWLNQPPMAYFTVTKDGLSALFNGASSYDPDGTIISWLWDFGDGVEGAGEVVAHAYLTSGTYNVTLTVIDDEGYENSITKDITVEVLQHAFIFGKYTNLTEKGHYLTIDAINLRIILFKPFQFSQYTTGEKITMSFLNMRMVIGQRFIMGLVDIAK